MRTPKNIGRTIGLLLLLQGIGGSLGTFALLGPVIAAPGFLVNAAAQPMSVSLDVLIGRVTGVLTMAIAITALPVLRQYSEALALWFLSLSVVGMTLAVVENNAVMSMLSLSQAYANAGATDEALFQALRGVVAASRNWAHYTHLMVGGATLLALYIALYRFALVPRALAALGLIAVPLQIVTLALPILGYPIVPLMLAPMGVSHLALTLWLAFKGFGTPPRPTDSPHPQSSGAQPA
jgi:Domain of unknown function (DUF4386)